MLVVYTFAGVVVLAGLMYLVVRITDDFDGSKCLHAAEALDPDAVRYGVHVGDLTPEGVSTISVLADGTSIQHYRVMLSKTTCHVDTSYAVRESAADTSADLAQFHWWTTRHPSPTDTTTPLPPLASIGPRVQLTTVNASSAPRCAPWR